MQTEERRAYQKAYQKTYKRKYRDRREYHEAYRDTHKEKPRDRIEYQKAYSKIYRQKEEVKERSKVAGRKRQALKLGNHHEGYTYTEIFERDGWLCGICGRKINKRLKYPNPRSKSIDHIVPLSKGGADAPINLQASHLRCNISKNANFGGQLRLIA